MINQLLYALFLSLLLLLVTACGGSSDSNEAPDSTAPILSAISATPEAVTAELEFNSDESGTAYYLAQVGGSTPTAEQVKNGSGNGGTVSGVGSALVITGANTISLNGLATGTSYSLFVMVEDFSDNQSVVASTMIITEGSVDFIAPILSAISASPQAVTAELNFNSDESGTAYYLAQVGGSTPTAEQVKNGSGNGGTVSGVGSTLVISGVNTVNLNQLMTGTSYVLYVFVEDSSGNQSLVGSIFIVTDGLLDTIAPILSAISATPQVETAELQFNSDESGTAYYLAQVGGSTPTAEQVKNGSGNGVAVAGAGNALVNIGENKINLGGLTASTSYTLYVIVEDASNNQSLVSSRIIITADAPPDNSLVAIAGDDQNVLVGATVELDGGMSTGDGNSLTYQWSFVSKPANSLAELSDYTIETPSFIADQIGDYRIQLVVNNQTIDSLADTVFIYSLEALPNLPDTGQETSYTDTFGEDEDYYTINPLSFTDNNNGTISDNNTQLKWQKEDDAIKRTWAEAVSYCEGLNLGGQTDWKLPNAKELQSIVNYGVLSPLITTINFPNTNKFGYWTINSDAANPDISTIVNFSNGFVDRSDKSNSYYVRCNRGGGEKMIWPLDFVNINNEIVSHISTGLMWEKDTHSVNKSWEDAISYCEGLNTGGYNNWRLPDAKELLSIVDYSSYNPSIDTDYFTTNTSSIFYWTSTTLPISTNSAFTVNFYTGSLGSDYKSSTSFKSTRCVRDDNFYNKRPVADAGFDQFLLMGSIVELDGSGSTDGDNHSLSFSWSFVSLPAESAAVMLDATTATPSFIADKVGDYYVQLIVNDGISDSYPATALIYSFESAPKLPDTGQETSYTQIFGEDNDYSKNTPAYENNIGTVTDNNTQLMWQIENAGSSVTWPVAVSYCEGLELDGFDDWRLPSLKELLTVIDYGVQLPSIDITYFPQNSANFWSSNSVVDDGSLLGLPHAWRVNTDYGGTDQWLKDHHGNVTCVRGGRKSLIWWPYNFSEIGDGVVEHPSTGLMWQKESDNIKRNWEDAISYCEGLSLEGFSDWKLPNVKELQSIVNYDLVNPSIDKTFFPNSISSSYWSSTPSAGLTDLSWIVNFNSGHVAPYTRSYEIFVRCTRDGG